MATAGAESQQQFADFKILRKLGEGAAGIVYHARQISFDRDAAVKVLFKHMAATPKHVERFYREARLAGRLDHPNIVQGYAVGEEQGLHYFAMEYVDGQSLQQWLEQLGRLRLGDALHITLAVARALAYAHEQDLVHRDVKPGNVLVSLKGEVKVSDLGMAKIRDVDLAALTRTGKGLGTPCYMPMEQFVNAKDADGRCDIYALGCTLHALLTGQPPFVSASFLELIQAKEAGTFPPARTVNPDVPERLDAIIAKMTSKRPDDRYRNCAEVIQALASLGLGESRLRLERPVQAPSVSAPETNPHSLSLPLSAPTSGTRVSATPSKPQAPLSATVREETLVDFWELTFPSADNQLVYRKLTTTQLLEWIGSKEFTPEASARRGSAAKVRRLGAFPELRQAVQDRRARKAPSSLEIPRSRPALKTKPATDLSTSTDGVKTPRMAQAGWRGHASTKPLPARQISWPAIGWWLAAVGAATVLGLVALRFFAWL